jgi:hypothetical protein
MRYSFPPPYLEAARRCRNEDRRCGAGTSAQWRAHLDAIKSEITEGFARGSSSLREGRAAPICSREISRTTKLLPEIAMFKVTIASVVLCCRLFAADAPMFRGDAAHSGVYASAAAPALDKLQWKFKTNGKVISSAVRTANCTP